MLCIINLLFCFEKSPLFKFGPRSDLPSLSHFFPQNNASFPTVREGLSLNTMPFPLVIHTY